MSFYKKFIISICIILITAAWSLYSQDNFSSFMTDEDISLLQWSGVGILNSRYSSDYNNIIESNIDIYPEINLNLDYIGERSEFHGSMEFSGHPDFRDQNTISLDMQQIIDEAYFCLYLNRFNLETGYIKFIWGKDDKVFTFDNINASDYTDFINPLYIDRKIAETLIKFNIPFGIQGMVETVYAPVFTPDIYPVNGEWVQHDYKCLPGEIEEITFNPENTSTIAHSQFGLRITNSFVGFDMGASYQYTFLRDPIISIISDDNFKISWDRVHLFGLETAFVILGFNIRSEAAYYLTADLSGDDPKIHNNRILYLFGFDRDLLVHNLSINIRGLGEIQLESDKISPSDIEYQSDGIYLSHRIEGGFRDSFYNGKITAELNGAWSIEDKDFMIIPQFRINLVEDTWLNMKYTFFYGGRNTLFGQFQDNDFLEIRMEYSF